MPNALVPTELAVPAYFLSDAHLGAPYIRSPIEQLRRLHGLLDQVGQRGRSLVLVGDLFDFWYEWRHVVPKRHFRVLHHLGDLVDSGVVVHYLTGNHDFRLHGFLESEVGLRVQADELTALIGEQRAFVFHGDGILARDHGYRLLKRTLRNRFAQRAFSWLHPDWGMRLARGTSKTSRTVIRGRPADDDEYLAYARRKFAEGFHSVVLGHTHRPLEHREGIHTYVNLGDWMVHFTYGLHDGARLRLMRFGQ